MKRKICLSIFISCFLCICAFSQQRQVSGSVTDMKGGGPLAGATIVAEGTGKTATTDSIGNFIISGLPLSKLSLKVSYVGYETQTVSLPVTQDVVVIKMNAGSNGNLNEVIVVGYQKQSLRKTTSSVQVISAKDIENLPAPSFDQLLQGKVAGVNIQNFSGEPGVRNTFVVRGNTTIIQDISSGGLDEARTLSTPLYVIDGMPMTITEIDAVSSTGTNVLAGININDIETITVQKDAAATAVWGSRGANGVVVIKTKRGRSSKPQFRVSYYNGITQRPELQKTVVGAEERRQKLELLRTYGSYSDLSNLPQLLTDSLNPYFNNAIDWQDLFYRQGHVNNGDMSISAGNEILNYRVGLNYYDEDGIVRNSGLKRYSMRGNFDFKINSKLNASLSMALSRLDRKRGLGRGRNEILPVSASSMPASFYKLSSEDYDFYLGQYDKLRDKNTSDLINASIQLNYNIVPGLQYTLNAGLSTTGDKRDKFQPTTITADGRSFASSNSTSYNQYTIANTLTYSKSIGEDKVHNIGIVATQSYDYKSSNTTYVEGYNVPTDNIQVVTGIPQQDRYGYSSFRESGLVGLLAQISYDYKGKYIINGSYRRDGSSRFGSDTKWGSFPSISGAWIVSDEKFMKNAGIISLLKLRASYGLSGTEPDDFYAPYNVWDINQGTYNGTSIATPSFEKPITLSNITWNKSKQFNAGIDLYLLNNRINLTVDAYRRWNNNPIFSQVFPFFTGYTSISYNAPLKILNEGIDVQIQTRNLPRSSDLQWTTNLNFNYNKNRLAALPNGNRSFYSDVNGTGIEYSVGQAIYTWAQMIYKGVYNNTQDIPVNPLTGQTVTYFKGNYPVRVGYPIWLDVNHDWDVWSDEDKGEARGDLVRSGDPNPKVTGGLYNEFTYHNFSLGVQTVFTLGRDIINTLMSNQFSNIWNFGNTYTLAANRLPDLSELNYWRPAVAGKPATADANFPSLSMYGNSYYQFLPFSTMWNQNGNYLKIKSITLGYYFPQRILSKIGLSNARIYSIMDNVAVFQKANVPDAEVVSPQGFYVGSAYPLPRKVTLGVEVTF